MSKEQVERVALATGGDVFRQRYTFEVPEYIVVPTKQAADDDIETIYLGRVERIGRPTIQMKTIVVK